MGPTHRWAAARGPIPLGSAASALSVYNFRVPGREAQCDCDVLLPWGWGLSDVTWLVRTSIRSGCEGLILHDTVAERVDCRHLKVSSLLCPRGQPCDPKSPGSAATFLGTDSFPCIDLLLSA